MNYIKRDVVVDSYKYIKELCENMADPGKACQFIIEYCSSRIDSLNTPEINARGTCSDCQMDIILEGVNHAPDCPQSTDEKSTPQENFGDLKAQFNEYTESLKAQINKEKYQKEFLRDLMEILVGKDWKKMTLENAETLTVIPKKDLVMDIVMRGGYAYEIVEETENDVAVIAHFENADDSDYKLKLWWDKEHCNIFRKCRLQEIK